MHSNGRLWKGKHSLKETHRLEMLAPESLKQKCLVLSYWKTLENFRKLIQEQ